MISIIVWGDTMINKDKPIALLVSIAVLSSFSLCGCNNKDNKPDSSISSTENSQIDDNSNSQEQQVIDYGDAESFEAALNAGENLEGKIVRFEALELHPESELGYNVWAGEHLNFISSRHPNIKAKDIVTVKATVIESKQGSWFIYYEKVDNAIENESTVTYDATESTTVQVTTVAAETTTVANETEVAETTNAPESSNTESTYEHNEFYDIVETSNFTNSRGRTSVIHKILAKKDAAITGTIIASDANGNVIGKSSDDIYLTEGQYNYFHYKFDNDISGATLQTNMISQNDSHSKDPRNGVEMLQYNQVDNDLFITVKQLVDSLGEFSRYKVLLYSGDQVVFAEDGFLSIYAENLNGKDSTDVIEVNVRRVDPFDRVEFFYEP